jgi:hypothetical protein
MDWSDEEFGLKALVLPAGAGQQPRTARERTGVRV